MDMDGVKIGALRAENQRFREALTWYADASNYETGQDHPDILIDGGAYARRILEQKTGT